MALQRLTFLIGDLAELAARMELLYEQFPELNEWAKISDVIPDSIDDWYVLLLSKRDEIAQQSQDSIAVLEGQGERGGK